MSHHKYQKGLSPSTQLPETERPRNAVLYCTRGIFRLGMGRGQQDDKGQQLRALMCALSPLPRRVTTPSQTVMGRPVLTYVSQGVAPCFSGLELVLPKNTSHDRWPSGHTPESLLISLRLGKQWNQCLSQLGLD